MPTARALASASKRRIKEATERAAKRLGNTPAICRKCYVHPVIFAAYLAGRVVPRVASVATRVAPGLNADERAVLAFLRRQLNAAEKKKPSETLPRLLGKSVRSAKQSLKSRD